MENCLFFSPKDIVPQLTRSEVHGKGIGTRARTSAALDALISVDSRREFQVYAALRAGFSTAATVDTLSRGKTNLRPWVLSFRAVAEDTAKGTSFEEDHTADAGAILKTVSLDVNDEGEVTHVVHRAGAPGL